MVPLEQGVEEGRQTGAEPAAARRRRSCGPEELRGAAIGAREARRLCVSWRLLRAPPVVSDPESIDVQASYR